MLILTKAIGIIIIIIGVVVILSPETMKKMMIFLKQGKRIYIAGILRLLFGAILLLAASQCSLAGVVVTLGILFIIGGVLIFVLGLEKVKSILGYWDKKSLSFLRLMGFIALVIGALVLYSV